MDRSMSYELDGAFSNRNAGELVNVQRTKTVMRRTPGLTASGADMPLGRRVGGPATRRLDPQAFRRIPTMSTTALSLARSTQALRSARAVRAATGLADAYSPMDGMGLELPVIGLVSWTQLAIGAIVGMGALALFRKRH